MEFASTDLDVIEDFIARAYAKARFEPADAPGVTSVVRTQIGAAVTMDRLRFGGTLAYDVEPLGTWCVCAVHTGRVDHTDAAGVTTAIPPGRIAALNSAQEPAGGVLVDTTYDVLAIAPEFLTRVAGARRDARPVRILSHHPHPARARMLWSVLGHVRGAAATADTPMATASLARYVTAAVLDAFPTSADPEAALDRVDAHPDTVRRAIAFLESHLREEITVTEIAAAAFVTPRAIQLAFRRHLGTTPMAYLRRLRLAAAHEQLRAATDSDRLTVTTVARHWGFAHPGRFASAYRAEYGLPPQQSLRS